MVYKFLVLENLFTNVFDNCHLQVNNIICQNVCENGLKPKIFIPFISLKYFKFLLAI